MLITGETAGKEVVARAIHSLSRRSKEAFLPVNCGAISRTLFLDEITEMPLEPQVRLLGVLETATVTRVGGNESFAIDVRIPRRHEPPRRRSGGGEQAAGGLLPL